MRNELRRLLPNLLIAVSSLLLTYVIADVGFRLYRHAKLPNEFQEFFFQATDVPIYSFDERIGFRYRPNLDVTYAVFHKDNYILQSHTFRINNLGHISLSDDSFEKPDFEYRIAVLGDSYTASVHSAAPWPSLLEKVLNSDSELKASLGVSTFKVINLGLDGTGIAQWENLILSEVPRYRPDLVVVNFIADDVRRKFVWRTSGRPPGATGDYELGLMCGSKPADLGNRDCAVLKLLTLGRQIFNDRNEISRIKREIFAREVDRIDWFSFSPELLARAAGGRFGLEYKLSLSGKEIPRTDDEEEAIQLSARSLRAIRASYPAALFLHNPDPDELLGGRSPELVYRLAGRDPSLGIRFVREFLPAPSDREEMMRWFNLPDDGHFSSYGAEVYAGAVHRLLRQYLSSGRFAHEPTS